MIQITVSCPSHIENHILSDFEALLKERLQKAFSTHAVFVFFFASKLETTDLSIKIEIASKRGVSEEEGKTIVTTIEAAYHHINKKYALGKMRVAIWLVPLLKAEEVRWFGGD